MSITALLFGIIFTIAGFFLIKKNQFYKVKNTRDFEFTSMGRLFGLGIISIAIGIAALINEILKL